jgi:hypothetical protein
MNQTFTNKTVVFDGSRFVGCSFMNCVIVITSSHFDFDKCSFYGAKVLVNPSIPITVVSHRLSQSVYEDLVCFWNDVYIDTETLSLIRKDMIS